MTAPIGTSPFFSAFFASSMASRINFSSSVITVTSFRLFRLNFILTSYSVSSNSCRRCLLASLRRAKWRYVVFHCQHVSHDHRSDSKSKRFNDDAAHRRPIARHPNRRTILFCPTRRYALQYCATFRHVRRAVGAHQPVAAEFDIARRFAALYTTSTQKEINHFRLYRTDRRNGFSGFGVGCKKQVALPYIFGPVYVPRPSRRIAYSPAAEPFQRN